MQTLISEGDLVSAAASVTAFQREIVEVPIVFTIDYTIANGSQFAMQPGGGDISAYGVYVDRPTTAFGPGRRCGIKSSVITDCATAIYIDRATASIADNTIFDVPIGIGGELPKLCRIHRNTISTTYRGIDFSGESNLVNFIRLDNVIDAFDPVSDRLRLLLGRTEAGGPFDWTLYDALGRCVLDRSPRPMPTEEVDVSRLPAGLHYWQLRLGAELVLDGKVVVE